MSGARAAALTALERCRKDGAWSAQALDAAIREGELSGRDAALASRLCLGVLQNGSLLDHYLGCFCTRELEPKVRQILRLGAYQLLFLDRVPARAAVSESVALCREFGCERACGLVNAVLRRLAGQRDDLPPIPGEGTASYLSLKYSHPQWLAERMLREKGYEFTEALFAADNESTGLTVQVNTLKVTPEDYRRALDRAEIPYTAFEELPGCLTLPGGSVRDLPGYEEGLFYVQDRAARTAVCAAGPAPGMRVLDLCSAPGGKSFALAMEMKNRGSILACDLHEKKLRLVSEGAARLGIDIIETRQKDARLPEDSWRGRFDLVVADVPCSGFGVVGKRPEIRWKKEEEIAALPSIQGAILDRAAEWVRPGGVLLYSTCTVLSAENDSVVRAFLAGHPDYAPEDFSVGAIRSRDGMYSFYPHRDGTDGFFAAKLRRNAET